MIDKIPRKINLDNEVSRIRSEIDFIVFFPELTLIFGPVEACIYLNTYFVYCVGLGL